MNDATFRIRDRGVYWQLERRKYSWLRGTQWEYMASGTREEVEREMRLAIKLPEYFDANGEPYDPAS
jgi:hypothetical protein